MTNSLNAIDFKYLLLEYYKKLQLNEEEAFTLLLIDHLLMQGNKFITGENLSLKMSVDSTKVDEILVSLSTKGYLTYDVLDNGDMQASIEPLKGRLYREFEKDFAKNKQNLNDVERNRLLTELYSYFERRLGRVLSPIENEYISKWLDDAYTSEMIKNALEDCIAAGKKNIKTIDKALRSNRVREDIKKEGYSGVNEDWNKSIEETIAIAKTKWIDDD